MENFLIISKIIVKEKSMKKLKKKKKKLKVKKVLKNIQKDSLI